MFSFSIKRYFYAFFLFLFSLTSVPLAKADSLIVVSDIKPIHSLVSMVVGDLGTSELIISRNVSPHDFSMRPSEVKLINNADIIFWTGPVLIPQFEKFFEELPPGTEVISLVEEVEDLLLPIRDLDSLFEDEDKHEHDEHHEDEHEGDEHHEDEHEHDEHEHEHDEHHEDEHEGDEHNEDEHEHDEHNEDEHEHDEHHEDEHEGDGHHGHGHHHHHAGGLDPHAWLDPVIALKWIDIIAEKMISKDPENAETYLSNAEQAKAKLRELDQSIHSHLHDIEPAYILYHDAFQYFETRYGLTPLGIIADQSSAEPGARHIRRLIERIAEEEVSCAFSEPVFEDDLLETVVSGAEIDVYEIDPTGATIEIGPDLYLDLISNIADSFSKCASSG